ncbi:MAG: hypothetical protein P4M02_07820 [Clostridia bacterium]|nr:hypothetical protein [Clostridia bacterium]
MVSDEKGKGPGVSEETGGSRGFLALILEEIVLAEGILTKAQQLGNDLTALRERAKEAGASSGAPDDELKTDLAHILGDVIETERQLRQQLEHSFSGAAKQDGPDAQ